MENYVDNFEFLLCIFIGEKPGIFIAFFIGKILIFFYVFLIGFLMSFPQVNMWVFIMFDRAFLADFLCG